jgi:AcrR family transcriptional regulator
VGTTERKEREKERRRQSILEAARKVFFEKGLQVASMDEIAEVAELSKGTLYLYFKSKEDLYVSLLDEGMAILQRLFSEVAARPLPADEALRQIGLAYYQFFKEYPDYFKILMFADARDFHTALSQQVLMCSEKSSLACLEIVAQVYARGVKEGLFREGPSPMEAAIYLWGTSNGMIGLIASKGEHFKAEHGIDLEALMVRTMRWTLNSMRVTPKKDP